MRTATPVVAATETATRLLAGYDSPHEHDTVLTIVRDTYAADILTRSDGAHVLSWTDGVANEWTETYGDHDSFAVALARLAALEHASLFDDQLTSVKADGFQLPARRFLWSTHA